MNEKIDCSECGKELTPETMWSEDTCTECAEALGLKSKIEIPKCPKCNEPMDTIHYEDCGPIIFDEEKGCYVDGGQSQQTIKCGNCGQTIGGSRGDGEHWGFLPERE